jgi:hypothetical protein
MAGVVPIIAAGLQVGIVAREYEGAVDGLADRLGNVWMVI